MDQQFMIVTQEVFDFLRGLACEIIEESWEPDELMSLLYEVFMAGKDTATMKIIETLEGSLEVGD